jgi:dTDP-4-amino-4,6-dideoxygalactose transaminase
LKKSIQVLQPFFRTEECLTEISDCLEKSWSGMGFKTIELEELWKDYTYLKNAHFLNSASAGLDLAVRIFKEEFGWPDGSEVITTALTFISTNHAILKSSLRPVFCDIDDSLNIDPSALKSLITERTKCVIFVGIGGNPQNLLEVAQICKDNHIKLILDAAHMAGAKIQGSHVGAESDVAVFSFQAVKNMPTADSGMICFQEKAFDLKARKLAWLGIDKDTFSRSTEGTYKWDYDVVQIGEKVHGNSIMAAMGIVALRYLDADNKYRNMLASMYEKYLDDSISKVKHIDGSSRHLYQILIDDRRSIIDALAKKNIFTGVHYKSNQEYSMFEKSSLPVTEKQHLRALSLPLHLHLQEEDIIYISKQINQIILK